jgi:hypothetical protein
MHSNGHAITREKYVTNQRVRVHVRRVCCGQCVDTIPECNAQVQTYTTRMGNVLNAYIAYAFERARIQAHEKHVDETLNDHEKHEKCVRDHVRHVRYMCSVSTRILTQYPRPN